MALCVEYCLPRDLEGDAMDHEIIIRGGTIIDGSGEARRLGDVAIDAGLITAVGDLSALSAQRSIDATGLLVTPGWVDIHTHYDGQVTWDDVLMPSSVHGVTTIVMGNCGVGFAPAAPDRHDWLIGLMEGVEDIPGSALAEGMKWEWESFPEYLDAIERRHFTMDIGTQIPHGSVRAYVMGEAGAKNEPANAEQIEAMRVIVRDAIAAGALGFSTSRTLAHVAIDGEPVPGSFAAEDELFGIGQALADLDAGVFELAPMGVAGEDVVSPAKEMAWMRRLGAAIKRPITFAMLQVDPAPNLWREMMDASLAALEDGADIRPQVPGRPTGLLTGHFTTYSLFDQVPAYQALKAEGLSATALLERLRQPAVREAITSWRPDDEGMLASLKAAFEKTYTLGSPPDYEPGPERSLAALAAAAGVHPYEVAYDAMLEEGGRGLLYLPIIGYSDGILDPIYEMLLHPRSALGLADGGAHVGIICDASMPTFMLTHWTRDRSRGPKLDLEWVVRKQTLETAALYGLGDRGLIAPGKIADLNLIDYEALELCTPEVVHDLPAGGARLLQNAKGYRYTIKSGVLTFVDGVDSGERPGGLLRGAR